MLELGIEVDMGLSESKDRYFVVDIENCRTTAEEASSQDDVSDVEVGNTNSTLISGGSVSLDSSGNVENGVNLVSSTASGGRISPENVKVKINKEVEGVKAAGVAVNKIRNERRKTISAKKPPRPPRSTRGLALDASDRKLIKEIAELATIKRARIERMKVLRKMKAAKGSSASNLSGIVFALFTLLLCMVIVFQGVLCTNCSTSSFQDHSGTSQSLKSLIMVPHQESMSSNHTG